MQLEDWSKPVHHVCRVVYERRLGKIRGAVATVTFPRVVLDDLARQP